MRAYEFIHPLQEEKEPLVAHSQDVELRVYDDSVSLEIFDREQVVDGDFDHLVKILKKLVSNS